jgi:hypothetical protein
MLEDLANAWLNANCPLPKVRRDFMRGILDAKRKGRNCMVIIGRYLTKSRKPFLVCGYAGELFVFELSPRQAENFGAAHDSMAVHRMGGDIELLRAPPPVVRLDAFQLHSLPDRKDTDPISGTCRYSVAATLHVPYAGMITYEPGPPQHVTGWCYPEELLSAPGGTLQLSFSPVRRADDVESPPWNGTMVVFVRLCLMVAPKKGGGRLPISNACAALLDVT